MEFDVGIDIPRGHRNKDAIDDKTRHFRLIRTGFTSIAYPAASGHIENTRCRDRDPLDTPVRAEEPTVPDCAAQPRLIEVLQLIDAEGPVDNVACSPAKDPLCDHLHELSDRSFSQIDLIQHLVEECDALEQAKKVERIPSSDRALAEAVVNDAMVLHRSKPTAT